MRASKLIIFGEDEQRSKDLHKYWEYFEEEVMEGFFPGDDLHDAIIVPTGQHKTIIMLEMPDGVPLVFYGGVHELDQVLAPMAATYAEHLRALDTARNIDVGDDNEIIDALETVSR